MKIQITAEDILTGDPAKCDTCPVARGTLRALRESKRPVTGVHVEADHIHMFYYYRCYSVWTPDIVERFIDRFDSASDGCTLDPRQHDTFEPFEFELPDDQLPPVEWRLGDV